MALLRVLRAIGLAGQTPHASKQTVTPGSVKVVLLDLSAILSELDKHVQLATLAVRFCKLRKAESRSSPIRLSSPTLQPCLSGQDKKIVDGEEH